MVDSEMREYFYPHGMTRRQWFFEQVLPWLIGAGIIALIFRFGYDFIQLVVSVIFNLKG